MSTKRDIFLLTIQKCVIDTPLGQLQIMTHIVWERTLDIHSRTLLLCREKATLLVRLFVHLIFLFRCTIHH